MDTSTEFILVGLALWGAAAPILAFRFGRACGHEDAKIAAEKETRRAA